MKSDKEFSIIFVYFIQREKKKQRKIPYFFKTRPRNYISSIYLCYIVHYVKKRSNVIVFQFEFYYRVLYACFILLQIVCDNVKVEEINGRMSDELVCSVLPVLKIKFILSMLIT